MIKQPPLERVATIYRQAATAGKPPAKTVAETLKIPQATAGAWIRRAKDVGLLKERVEVKKRNVRALRVAEALGIEYDVLVAAVMKHAGGDLRVSS